VTDAVETKLTGASFGGFGSFCLEYDDGPNKIEKHFMIHDSTDSDGWMDIRYSRESGGVCNGPVDDIARFIILQFGGGISATRIFEVDKLTIRRCWKSEFKLVKRMRTCECVAPALPDTQQNTVP
tara:strand:- start:745 stop:1119 length:375 start_codon:yes stop_codon:yes gene_type:complete